MAISCHFTNFFEFINYKDMYIVCTDRYWHLISKIVHQTTERLRSTISNSCEWRFPLKLQIADGLEGTGSHRIYNQLPAHPDKSTNSFLLFSFKIISLYVRTPMLLIIKAYCSCSSSLRNIIMIYSDHNIVVYEPSTSFRFNEIQPLTLISA